jgi:hypothetical protein
MVFFAQPGSIAADLGSSNSLLNSRCGIRQPAGSQAKPLDGTQLDSEIL